MLVSVITPAHNEELLIGECIESVQASARRGAVEYEHIVVLNRCTDRTETIAQSHGCRLVTEDARNLSRIRNRGVAASTGAIVVTIDADSTMTPNMLGEVVRRLESDRFVGGGASVRPERWSVGIACSLLVVAPFVLWHRVSTGMFWCRRHDFDAVGGFDESLACVEDIDFAKRLKVHGRAQGLRYGTIRNAHVVTSCRKFDQFGDWHFVRNPSVVFDIFRRKHAAADSFYYDARGTGTDRSDPSG